MVRAFNFRATRSKGDSVRVVIQRVSEAAVAVGGEEIGRIGVGYLVLVGFAAGDPRGVVDYMSDKLVGLRLFPDHEGKMNLALPEVGGAILAVSQFTLYGDASKGRRPSFIEAARPEEAIPLYEAFLQALRDRGVPVAHGRFGADMQVSLINDGPVTLILERSTA